jgi:hypothetical protein
MNLVDGFKQELERARELLIVYQGTPTGQFGAMMIKQAIERAETSILTGDVVEMIRSYNELKALE